MSGWRKLPRLGRPQRAPRTPVGRTTTLLVFVVAGLIITISSIAARGTDLRSDRNLSLRELIIEQGHHNAQLQQRVEAVRSEVDELSSKDLSLGSLSTELEDASLQASTMPVAGPGVRVTLSDAPPDVKPAGVDDDSLVVHQQDIQSVVNALWAGGAEALSIQGQRVVATTGIKCVGNTVVLHGVPYAPPYVIEAIGDQQRLEDALRDSKAVEIYQQYVAAYGLGYAQERRDVVDMPGYSGTLNVDNARQR